MSRHLEKSIHLSMYTYQYLGKYLKALFCERRLRRPNVPPRKLSSALLVTLTQVGQIEMASVESTELGPDRVQHEWELGVQFPGFDLRRSRK